MVRQSGWGGLYKGNLVSVLHSAPQKALSFFAFDAFKARRRPPLPMPPQPHLTQKFLCWHTSCIISGRNSLPDLVML